MKYLYKYPQAAYPYEDLVKTNWQRTRHEQEYELIDTGVFDQNRYFDVFVEYAKASPEDPLIKISICNRGPESALIHLLPTLWFRNTWSWSEKTPKPILKEVTTDLTGSLISASHPILGDRYLYREEKVKEGEQFTAARVTGAYPIFLAEDAAVARNMLLEHGVRVEEIVNTGGVLSFGFFDPDDNRLEVCQV